VIGPDGTIVAANIKQEELVETVAKALGG